MNIVLLTNILTPYRRFFYDKLHEHLTAQGISFTVLVMAETEPNRAWRYDDYKSEYTSLLQHKSRVIANMYMHFNQNLQEKLVALQPDLVVAAGSYTMPSVLQAIWWKRKLNYKLLFWSESHLGEKRDYSRAKLAARECIRQHVFRQFDGFWYAGQLSLKFIKKYANPDAAFFFVPNLVDNRVFAEAAQTDREEIAARRAALEIGENKFVFICPARLTPVKGLHTFIALAEGCRSMQSATVLIPGDGELKPELERMIAQSGLDIRLLGYKKQAEIINLYAMADCFLMPSLSDPNPLTCIEALWSGLPLFVSTHVGNYPEVVKPAQNGFVFDYANPAQAVALLDKLITADEVWRRNARQVSLQLARARYEPDEAVRSLIAQLKAYYQQQN